MPERPEEQIGTNNEAADALRAIYEEPQKRIPLLPPPDRFIGPVQQKTKSVAGEVGEQVAAQVDDQPTAQAAEKPAEPVTKEVIPPPDPIAVFDIDVRFSTEGKPVGFIDKGGRRVLNVNIKRFNSNEKAIRAGVLQALYVQGLRETLVAEGKPALEVAKEFPKSARQAQIMKGLKKLTVWDPQLADKLAKADIEKLTYTAQFDYACHQYLLTGECPKGLSPEAKEAFDKLTKYGKNVLDFISEETRTLKSAVSLYREHVLPVKKELLELQKELGETEADDYEPPEGGDDMESQEIDPETIRFKVYPPLSGYYRKNVYSYDPDQLKVVTLPTTKSLFAPRDLPDDLEKMKRYTLTGAFLPEGDNAIPLPEKAVPLPATIDPADKFIITRDTRGVFYVEAKDGAKITEETPFSFEFIMHKCDDNEINDAPSELDLKTMDGPRGEKSQEFLDALRANKFLGPVNTARAIISYIKKTLRYPEEEEMGEMDAKYKAAQAQLQLAIDDHEITDCHWSNIYGSLAGRLFDIPWRNAAGFSAQKIKDLDFTPLGGTGHMWSEIWDEDNGTWIRMDATPSKENDDEDEEEEDGEANAPGGDEKEDGEIDEDAELDEGIEEGEVLELDDEELQKLIEEIDEAPMTQFEMAQAMLRERTNVDPEQWRKVKEFVAQVNATQIAPEDQIPEDAKLMSLLPGRISAPRGTLEREWEKLFCHIVRRRLVKKRAFKGPVPQSEGVAIMDPTMAVIDILSQVDDPMGFTMEAQRTRVELDVSEFEEDALIDLTSSMEDCDRFGNVMKVEQKKMILTMLHALMRLNEKLNDSRTKNNLREPVTIRSAIYSIHGGSRKNAGKYAVIKEGEEMITEQVLANLFRELDITTPGSGDMLSALLKYKERLTPEQLKKIKAGKLTKMLTIYSDGNLWCASCGCEGCGVQMHHEKISAVVREVKNLRELGIIVQGIGFTYNGRSIKTICRDPNDPDAAVVIDNVSEAVVARQRMMKKHLQKI